MIQGDFNVHHPILVPYRSADAAAYRMAEVLVSCPEIAPHNSYGPTHVRGEALEFTFAIATLVERIS